MEDVELKNESAAKEWATGAMELRLSQLEDLERDGVHIQCVGSTDFVLGRQTNFNGPVTIINCPDVLRRATCMQESKTRGEEQIVIREKVMSQSAAIKIHNIATEQQVLQGADRRTLCKCRNRAPLFLCTGLLIAAVVAAPTFLTQVSTTDEPKTSQCMQLADNVCLYSQFRWGGRPPSKQTKPLQLPVPYLAISPTQDDDYCYEYNVCLEVLERFQLNRTADPACNFLLGGEGNAYEDLGWKLVSTPDSPVPDKLLRICLMGGYIEDWPTYPQEQAFSALLQFGLDRNYVAEDYVLLGWKVTAFLYKVISKWPRFRNETPSQVTGPHRPVTDKRQRRKRS